MTPLESEKLKYYKSLRKKIEREYKKEMESLEIEKRIAKEHGFTLEQWRRIKSYAPEVPWYC